MIKNDMIILLINIFHFFVYFFKSLILVLLIVFLGAVLSFLERRILGLFQNRYGPNRVGWFGILQVLADMIKMLFKEDWIPQFSRSFIFILAPIISFLSSLFIIGTIPINNNFFIINLNIGILFFLMLASLSVYSIIFAGWSSNNKYALLGSIRAVAQTISYEIFLGLSLMGVVAKAHSFNFFDIVYSQKNLWNIIPQFFGFLTFLISGLALCHRHPFDFPETEQELADGYHIEYSGMKFGMFFIGQYILMLVVACLITILFCGGWYGPFCSGIFWFSIKVIFFVILFILIRASLPRPRYDQILYFGWIMCFPLSLLNLIFTALLILIF